MAVLPVRSTGKFIGLSTDSKPTADIQPGSTFFEYDTKKLYVFEGGAWGLKSVPPEILSAITTIDLEQAAADYDLFDAPTTIDIQIQELVVIIPADLTGDAAGSLTSISVQSTDDTPVEFISSTAGAKANLTAGKHLQYTGFDTVEAGKKIQLTIAGGETSDEQVCHVYIVYREVA